MCFSSRKLCHTLQKYIKPFIIIDIPDTTGYNLFYNIVEFRDEKNIVVLKFIVI